MRIVSIIAASLLASGSLASSASAVVYSVGADFGNPVFAYGTVSTSNHFTKFNQSDCSAIGVTSTCYRGTDAYQVVFKRSPDSLLIHPGPADMQNTFVTFTAPRSGLYTYDLTVTRGDSGDGVNIYNTSPAGLVLIGRVDDISPTFSLRGTQFFSADEVLGLGVDRGGADSNYFGDSTFLSGTISGTVPEPAAWTLMIAGFGLVGATLRRRPAANVAA